MGTWIFACCDGPTVRVELHATESAAYAEYYTARSLSAGPHRIACARLGETTPEDAAQLLADHWGCNPEKSIIADYRPIPA